MKLLLVEDEEDLNALLAKGLRKNGYAVDSAFDGEEALYYCEINEYDLIILDLNLPKIDGIEVLRRIRQADLCVKILILSARSKIEERVLGLDLGANDYLVKPFDFLELNARVRTLLRLSYIQHGRRLTCGRLHIDTIARIASAGTPPEEQTIDLTRKEYAILEYLFLHQNQILSAEQLIEHVWDSEAGLFSNSLKYHVHSLKKKLREFGVSDYIRNVRGQGYILSEREEVSP